MSQVINKLCFRNCCASSTFLLWLLVFGQFFPFEIFSFDMSSMKMNCLLLLLTCCSVYTFSAWLAHFSIIQLLSANSSLFFCLIRSCLAGFLLTRAFFQLIWHFLSLFKLISTLFWKPALFSANFSGFCFSGYFLEGFLLVSGLSTTYNLFNLLLHLHCILAGNAIFLVAKSCVTS